VASRAKIVRCIIDSMALAIRDAVRSAVDLSGRSVSVVHVVGGGVENELFCQSVADACEPPVVAGPTEARSYLPQGDGARWARAAESVRG
jgi:rhamnulokinase